MEVFQSVFNLVLLFAFAIFMIRFLTAGQLIKLRFKKANYQIVEGPPEYFVSFIAPCVEELKKLGFEFSYYLLEDGSFEANGLKKWIGVCIDKEKNTSAIINSAGMPEPPFPYYVSFSTCFNDDTMFETVKYLKKAIVGDVPNITIEDAYAGSLEKHYNFHLKKVKESKKEAVWLEPETYVAKLNENYSRFPETLEKTGVIAKQEDNAYALKNIPAFKIANRVVSWRTNNAKRTQAFVKVNGKEALKRISVPTELETEALLMQEAHYFRERSTPSFRNLLFVVTLALLILSFYVFSSVKWSVFIAVLLIIHEAGHYFAMHAFGYKDKSIMFIPFLGAVTSGVKEDAPAYQKVLIYFAGPVPGLIIGGFVFSASILLPGQNHFLMLAGGTILSLNYFNLIPVLPFDGGQIFSVSLFSKFPMLDAIFYSLSVLAFAILAIYLQSILLGILAVAFFLGIPLKIKNAMLIKELRKYKNESLTEDRKELIYKAFSILKAKKYGMIPWMKKVEIIKSTLAIVRTQDLKLKQKILFAGLYLFVIILPAIIYIAGLIAKDIAEYFLKK